MFNGNRLIHPGSGNNTNFNRNRKFSLKTKLITFFLGFLVLVSVIAGGLYLYSSQKVENAKASGITTYSCPSGWNLSGNQCTQTATSNQSWNCSNHPGYSNGSTFLSCVKTYTTTSFICPSGQQLPSDFPNFSSLYVVSYGRFPLANDCMQFFVRNGSTCVSLSLPPPSGQPGGGHYKDATCPGGTGIEGIIIGPANPNCNFGDSVVNGNCQTTLINAGVDTTYYTCPSGGSVSGSQCTMNASPTGCTGGYLPPSCNQCPTGQIDTGSSCTNPTTSCPAGQYLSGSSCVACPINTYKSTTGTSVSECVACPTGSTSPAGSNSINSCSCPTGQGFNAAKTACIPLTCSNGATNSPACTQCPNGATVVGPSQQCPTVIDPTLVDISTDCTQSLVVIIPTTYTCHFPLKITGNQNVSYILPPGNPTVASTSTATGVSNSCTYDDTTKIITCTGVPSLNGTPAVQDVNLAIGGVNPTPKGKVTLKNLIDLVDSSKTVCNKVTGDPTYTTNPSVVIGNTYSCQFEISDNTINPANFPNEVFTAATSVNGGTDTTPLPTTTDNTDCKLVKDNSGVGGISRVYINCLRIPTSNGTVGLRNVLLKQNALPFRDEGNVTLLDAGSLLIESVNTTFNPNEATSKEYGKADVTLTVQDNRIASGAACSFNYSPYPNKTTTTTNYIPLGNNAIVYGTNAQATLTVTQQSVPKWRFKVVCTNPSTATNGYASRVFTAFPDYAFKYGAIVIIDVGGVGV